MTFVNYVTKTDLQMASPPPNLDPAIQQAVLNQLVTDGLFSAVGDDGRRVWVESDFFDGKLSNDPSLANPTPLFNDGGNQVPLSWVQALEVDGQDVTVQTNGTALRVIIDDGLNAGVNKLTVQGDNPEWIGLGNSKTMVTLLGHGNDTVMGGDGSDTILGNDGDDTLIAGKGANSWLQAGSGKTVITDQLSGGTDTLVAGSGPDTITGLQGDQFWSSANPMSMPGSGHDVYNVYGSSGNSTIELGMGSDTVNFFSTGGNDTINNHGGVDTIDFRNSATSHLTDVVGGPTAGALPGDYVLHFSDGQTVTLNAHGQSGGAFVIEFKDTTLTLPGS